MLVWDVLPVILHGLKWCVVRAFRTKYFQVEGAPQGNNFIVGLMTLFGNFFEHTWYQSNPQMRQRFARARWLDDVVV